MPGCFKAYDIRGRVPDELDEDMAWAIGRACAEYLQAGSVVVGEDVRLSSPALAAALSRGLVEGGSDVIRIGLGGTEDVYFATSHLDADGGIMVTASHNPIDWNGMKLVREGSRPISGDSGLGEIQRLVEQRQFRPPVRRGIERQADVGAAQADFLLRLVDPDALKPLRIVVNAGNGAAGLLIDRLAAHLPFEFIRLQHEPDGSFPHGIPNPLLPDNRQATAEAVRAHRADLGVAWDGDYDRCFLFDERGEFIEGYYIVGLLAAAMLERQPGATIVHDPRLVWNTIDIVTAAGGRPVQSKTGHAFIKETMRAVDAVYGGEMSAHHYFREFYYCDSGMIPWLLVARLLGESGKPLSALVGERIARFPCSGEINRAVADPAAALARVRARFAQGAIAQDTMDGLGLEFPDWRFNLRMSNTEPLIRLNVETRADPALLARNTQAVLALLDGD